MILFQINLLEIFNAILTFTVVADEPVVAMQIIGNSQLTMIHAHFVTTPFKYFWKTAVPSLIVTSFVRWLLTVMDFAEVLLAHLMPINLTRYHNHYRHLIISSLLLKQLIFNFFIVFIYSCLVLVGVNIWGSSHGLSCCK